MWMPRDGYLIKKKTIAIVKKAIVVINRLWPQRAISPIMFNSNKKYVLQPGAWLRICCTYLGCGTLQFKCGADRDAFTNSLRINYLQRGMSVFHLSMKKSRLGKSGWATLHIYGAFVAVALIAALRSRRLSPGPPASS